MSNVYNKVQTFSAR